MIEEDGCLLTTPFVEIEHFREKANNMTDEMKKDIPTFATAFIVKPQMTPGNWQLHGFLESRGGSWVDHSLLTPEARVRSQPAPLKEIFSKEKIISSAITPWLWWFGSHLKL